MQTHVPNSSYVQTLFSLLYELYSTLLIPSERNG